MTTPASILKRISELERAAVPAGEVPYFEGLDALGNPLYLNMVTGELVPELPERGKVTARLGIDLTAI